MLTDNKIEFNLVDFLPTPLVQDFLLGLEIPTLPKDRPKLQNHIAHHTRQSKIPKRTRLWHKLDLKVYAEKMLQTDKISEEEEETILEWLDTTYEFSEESVLMSELFSYIGMTHNGFFMAREEYEEIGFGPLLSTSGSDYVRYFNLSDELIEKLNRYDFCRLDVKDKEDLYTEQIQAKLRFLSFGNY